MITLGAVNITDKTKELMKEALEKGKIGQGEYIQEFERRLAEFLGVKHVIATANGTLADASALAALKYKDGLQRNEVIVPALTFVSQINAVYYNHLKPVFVDVSYNYQIDSSKIEEKINEKTLAIMPVHLLGRPAEMEKILALAKKYNLFVVEDACEALGSKYQNKHCGTIGDMGCFSFFVSHSITTGEGGAVVTNNDELAGLVRSLRNHGRKSDKPEEKFIFPYLGFSGKMNCLEAIIGLGIIDELPKYLERRRQNMIKLNEFLAKDWFSEKENEYIVPHSYPIMLESEEIRNQRLRDLPEKFGIEARQIFSSIPTQTEAYGFLKKGNEEYPIAEDIGRRGLYVPCHQNLTEEDVIKISQALKEIIKKEDEQILGK
jgi:dTDP-4-amino-4,6-dideoxygalactose transaminase